MKVNILRIEETDQGIIGVMLIENKAFCCSLEPDNKDDEPCIPEGNYTCKRVISPKFGDTFEVKDVPGRTHILFHKGNIEGHTLGCIIIGQYFGKLGENRAVLNSGNTFKRFMKTLDGIDSFKLRVINIVELENKINKLEECLRDFT